MAYKPKVGDLVTNINVGLSPYYIGIVQDILTYTNQAKVFYPQNNETYVTAYRFLHKAKPLEVLYKFPAFYRKCIKYKR